MLVTRYYDQVLLSWLAPLAGLLAFAVAGTASAGTGEDPVAAVFASLSERATDVANREVCEAAVGDAADLLEKRLHAPPSREAVSRRLDRRELLDAATNAVARRGPSSLMDACTVALEAMAWITHNRHTRLTRKPSSSTAGSAAQHDQPHQAAVPASRLPAIVPNRDPRIAHIIIPTFDLEGVAGAVMMALQDPGLRGAVLNLAGNLGGLKAEGLVLASALLPPIVNGRPTSQGIPLFKVRSAEGEQIEGSLSDGELQKLRIPPRRDLSIGLVIDRNTHSTAEIVAAAVPGTRAGQPSGGKFSAQGLYDLPLGHDRAPWQLAITQLLHLFGLPAVRPTRGRLRVVPTRGFEMVSTEAAVAAALRAVGQRIATKSASR